jgi:hypothetical protein
VLLLTPDNLLIDPCVAAEPGTTPRALAKAYVANNNCIGDYKRLLEKQRKHKAEQINLYKKKDE